MLSFFKFPKNDQNYYWTSHSKSKMLQYRISEGKIKAILQNPARTEGGIAPKTLAVMKRNDTPKRKEEMWVMYQILSKNDKKSGLESFIKAPDKKAIISVWRYPGVSKKRNVPMPEDVLEELEKLK
ncbi:MAG: Uncharacterized protein Athens071426_295 [Parcubacteria group bacterium Athens0714_26]|nr:MAG: Uncharacterized protein Athens101426_320 [Parcubacteria group bacterium Athens1014_26]TSD03101.1 MAG: Uncharacterized protein Athens071426_295 [Parcubacteria group bacterium Athens0714_26]